MADVAALLADLDAESDVLDDLVGALTDDQWRMATPAPGWTIADQIAHLGVDRRARRPRGDRRRGVHCGRRRPDRRRAVRRRRRRQACRPPAGGAAGVVAGLPGPARRGPRRRPGRDEAAVVRPADGRRLDGDGAADGDVGARPGRRRRPRRRLASRPTACATSPTSASGPATSPSASTASRRPPRSSGSSWTGPTGDVWAWGPEHATQRVSGPALDFCLLVTQRRHRDDLAVTADGRRRRAVADHRPGFAGPPGDGAPSRSEFTRERAAT